jgi:hypothetical protein
VCCRTKGGSIVLLIAAVWVAPIHMFFPSKSCAKRVRWTAGDISSLAHDVPSKLQLSVWSEFNLVGRRKLVWEAATALRCCAVGGSIVLRIADVITTFTTGVLCILARNFTRFYLVKPFTTCAASAETFGVFTGRAADPNPEEIEGLGEPGHEHVIASSHAYMLEV